MAAPHNYLLREILLDRIFMYIARLFETNDIQSQQKIGTLGKMELNILGGIQNTYDGELVG